MKSIKFNNENVKYLIMGIVVLQALFFIYTMTVINESTIKYIMAFFRIAQILIVYTIGRVILGALKIVKLRFNIRFIFIVIFSNILALFPLSILAQSYLGVFIYECICASATYIILMKRINFETYADEEGYITAQKGQWKRIAKPILIIMGACIIVFGIVGFVDVSNEQAEYNESILNRAKDYAYDNTVLGRTMLEDGQAIYEEHKAIYLSISAVGLVLFLVGIFLKAPNEIVNIKNKQTTLARDILKYQSFLNLRYKGVITDEQLKSEMVLRLMKYSSMSTLGFLAQASEAVPELTKQELETLEELRTKKMDATVCLSTPNLADLPS